MKLNELLSILTDRRAGVGILQRLRQARESLRMRRVLEDFPPLKERRYITTRALGNKLAQELSPPPGEFFACPLCVRVVQLNSQGKIRTHRVPGGFPLTPVKSRPLCGASGQPGDLQGRADLKRTPFDYSPEPIDDDEPDRNRGPFGA